MNSYIKMYKNFLLESKNLGILYHFTMLESLYSMMKDGHFKVRNNDLVRYRNKYPYSISLTRDKNFDWGDVKIYLDGTRLSENYFIKPVSFFQTSRNQAEERMYLKTKEFPIFDYVIKIDILRSATEYHFENMDDIEAALDELGITYNIVDNF